MPFIIDPSFFVGDINLPNVDDTRVAENINSFIAKYEPECLLKLLGYPLFKLVGNETSPRMTALMDGAEYTDYWCKELRKWQGLKHDTNQSLIAFFVFFQIMNSRDTQVTSVAVIKGKTNAGQSVSVGDKMVTSWNKFSEEAYQLISFLWSKNDTRTGGIAVYPEFTWTQFLKTKNFSRPINEFF